LHSSGDAGDTWPVLGVDTDSAAVDAVLSSHATFDDVVSYKLMR